MSEGLVGTGAHAMTSLLRSLRGRTPMLRARGHDDGARNLVGVDLSPELRARSHASLIALAAVVLVGSLALVGLRSELLRMHYTSTELVKSEQQLQEVKQTLLVEMRRLRDPARLARHAQELGFVHPQRVIDIREPSQGDTPAAVSARP